MSLPPLPKNFASAVDLSSLGKPAQEAIAIPGIAVNQENLISEILPASNQKVVILICWSPRSTQAVGLLEIMGKYQAADLLENGEPAWVLGTVNVDAEAQVAQALQIQSVPIAIAIIQEQMVPLFEQAYPEAQIRLVIDKVLALSAQQGIGEAPVEQIEPEEEEEAMMALESGNYALAEAAYKKWLARKPNESLAKLGLAQTQLLIRTEGLDLNIVVEESEKSPQDIDLQLKAADIEIVNGGVEAAFSRLLTLIKTCTGDDKNKVKTHLLNLFALVDQGDPRLVSARKELANSIF